ncbi:MAG: FtsQ-type POTRA domain-containing protein [Oscillatoriaceae cyanobacterium]
MGRIAPVSKSELAQRRRLLRGRRRRVAAIGLWQLLAPVAMAAGLAWATTLPGWVIRRPEQVAISGNEFLSPQAVRSMLPLEYPQFLLQVRPKLVAQQLESMGPLTKAKVTRQLFPPGLSVEVEERYPVAVAEIPSTTKEATGGEKGRTAELGFLDSLGVWTPQERYTSLVGIGALPTLKVIGNPVNYRPYWPVLYSAISRSSVRVYEIDWRDVANVILKSDIGTVHLGASSDRFPRQIAALERMKELPKQVNPTQIVYIDLKNPDAPTLQMTNAQKKPPKQ